MARKGAKTSGASGARRVFTYVAVAVLAAQLLSDFQVEDVFDAETAVTFATLPSVGQSQPNVGIETYDATGFGQRAAPHTFGRGGEHGRSESGRTGRRAAAVPVATVTQKVLHAMGAGAVASVIQAALSAVGEPIVNRVLVKRMTIRDAINDVSPAMMLDFFKTTLATNFLKFPFFEAINAFCACMPLSGSIRGIITGAIFTTATLPVTNYRYRKSMQLEVDFGALYEAYLPTVIRDIVYGIIRNYATMGVLQMNSAWTNQSAQVLFIVVIIGCLGSAPFNEWRGYLLQTKGQKIPFGEFFKPSNFVRSTSLGALKQGLAIAAGYWCTPAVSKFVHGLMAGFKG